MIKENTKSFVETAFATDDFRGLGRRKIRRLLILFLSEFFATAIPVYLSCSTIQANLFGKSQTPLVIAIASCFAIGTSIMLFGHISGAYINPCVSFTAVILSHMSLYMSILYSTAQCLGATFGYALTMGILPSSLAWNSTMAPYDHEFYSDRCCTVPNPKSSIWQALLAEICGTAILMWASCSAWDKRNEHLNDSTPIKMAVVMVAIALPTSLYSGCSLNPARSFGPAVYNGLWKYHWVYWIGPFIGTIIASVLYRIVFNPLHMKTGPELRTEACLS